MLAETQPKTTATLRAGLHGGHVLRLEEHEGICTSLDREEELHKEEQLEWLAVKRRLFILFPAYLRHFRVLRRGGATR